MEYLSSRDVGRLKTLQGLADLVDPPLTDQMHLRALSAPQPQGSTRRVRYLFLTIAFALGLVLIGAYTEVQHKRYFSKWSDGPVSSTATK